MSTPIVYKSTDASAPAISGSAGALITVLDACLVNGYGAKAAAGWTKSFSGTNLAAYRMPAANQLYLAVDDTGTTTSLIRGYEAMTAVSTGTGPFPTVAQVASLYVHKSSTASGAARAWVVIADDRTFYMFNNLTLTSAGGPYLGWGFGDMYSYRSGDNYRVFIQGNTDASASPAQGNGDIFCYGVLNVASTGMYMPRTSLGTVTAVNVARLAFGNTANGKTVGSQPPAYPNVPDNYIYVNRVPVVQPALEVRGYMRGAYQLLSNPSSGSYGDGDTFTGVGDFASRTFMIIGRDLDPTYSTYTAIETTAWDTSS